MEAQTCQLWGAGPATRFVVRRHVGLVLVQRFYKVDEGRRYPVRAPWARDRVALPGSHPGAGLVGCDVLLLQHRGCDQRRDDACGSGSPGEDPKDPDASRAGFLSAPPMIPTRVGRTAGRSTKLA